MDRRGSVAYSYSIPGRGPWLSMMSSDSVRWGEPVEAIPDQRLDWDRERERGDGRLDHDVGAVLLRPGVRDSLRRLILMHLFEGLEDTEDEALSDPALLAFCPACGSDEPTSHRHETYKRVDYRCVNPECGHRWIRTYCVGCKRHLWKLGPQWNYHATRPMDAYDIKCPNCSTYRPLTEADEAGGDADIDENPARGMTYTLFIDESGDFDTFNARKGWVVSGVLCPGKRGQAEKNLRGALQPVAKREGLHTPEQVHLTDRRTEWGDHKRVGRFAEQVLRAAAAEGCRFMAVVNRGDVRMREPERTYRLMVLDLLALVDAVAPADLDRLDIVIAQRKERGAEERMSSKDELLADVIGSIEDSVEAGLAARGLLERLDAEPFVVWTAGDSWALGAADAVANLTFQRRYPESGGVLERLRRDGLYEDFEAFGAYAERRARVAERDGDLSGAVVRWARLNESDEQAEALDRVWRRALGRGTAGPMATLDAAVELLWRTPGRSEVADALGAVEASLSRIGAPSALLYRVRDMMHLRANHRGDLEDAARLQVLLEAEDPAIAADPATLPLVLKSMVHRMTTAELRIDFESVLLAARLYADVVEQYGVVTSMLREEMGVGGDGASHFEASRLWLKARTSLVRGLILSATPADLEEAASELEPLLGMTTMQDDDRLRVACYRVWLVGRAGRREEALLQATSLLEEEQTDAFALAFAARAAADAAFFDGTTHEDACRTALEVIRSRATEGVGYPHDLLWRDLGVLEATVGRGAKAARRAFGVARTALDVQAASPMTAWKRYGLELCAIRFTEPAGPPPSPPSSGLAAPVVEAPTPREAAEVYRRVSPY